jgi:hypothetical protein
MAAYCFKSTQSLSKPLMGIWTGQHPSALWRRPQLLSGSNGSPAARRNEYPFLQSGSRLSQGGIHRSKFYHTPFCPYRPASWRCYFSFKLWACLISIIGGRSIQWTQVCSADTCRLPFYSLRWLNYAQLSVSLLPLHSFLRLRNTIVAQIVVYERSSPSFQHLCSYMLSASCRLVIKWALYI